MPKEKEPIHVSKRRRIKWTTLTKIRTVVVPSHFTNRQVQNIIDNSEVMRPYLLHKYCKNHLKESPLTPKHICNCGDLRTVKSCGNCGGEIPKPIKK